MRKVFIVAFLFLALTGCASWPFSRAPDNLWYAESETPNWFGYHVYVLFLDDSHFIWWRTPDAQNVVLNRLDYYKSGEGAVQPTLYTRQGDQLKGELRRPWKGRNGETIFTMITNFDGSFSGELLDMEMVAKAHSPDGKVTNWNSLRWALKRMGHQPSD